MTDLILPKYSQIYTINNKSKCKIGGNHDFFEKKIKVYNKNNTLSNEIVFECKNCKKRFIVPANKDRFLISYPLYIINQEFQDKTLSLKEIKKIQRREKSKEKKRNKKEAEKKKKEEGRKQRMLELEKMNSPEEKRRQIILKKIANNNIQVLTIEHEHHPLSVTYKKLKLLYCEKCNLLYCYKKDYERYIKMGIPKKKFYYYELEHIGMSQFNKKKKIVSSEKKQNEKKKKDLIINQPELKKQQEVKKLEQTELELGLGLKQTQLNFDYIESEHSEIKEEKSKSNTDQIHKVEELIKKKEETILPKADFFVRTNSGSCSNKDHKIIDFLAEVDVICSNGNIIKKAFPASYCENCKLYFMYDEQYKKIKKSGVPLCSIYEYSKYIKIKNTGKIELKPESLLHSFGYNVGASEALTTKQRRKILSFVIDNGVMNKHEIINFLSYLVDFKKNDKKQVNAITKWKIDIEYLQTTDIETNKKVEVNSIRVINIINKKRR